MEPIAADEMVIEYVGQNIRQVSLLFPVGGILQNPTPREAHEEEQPCLL